MIIDLITAQDLEQFKEELHSEIINFLESKEFG